VVLCEAHRSGLEPKGARVLRDRTRWLQELAVVAEPVAGQESVRWFVELCLAGNQVGRLGQAWVSLGGGWWGGKSLCLISCVR
jgi:hypothetical protein